jgi:hypothetical protein
MLISFIWPAQVSELLGNLAAHSVMAMDVGLSTMGIWVKQLRDERQDKKPKSSPITPE